jgi:GNAT superfamily N-acetyltransferase
VSGRNRYEALEVIRRVLADDCACDPEDFTRDEILVTPHDVRPSRRRYPVPDLPLMAITTGAGVVISAHPDRIETVRAVVEAVSRDDLFSAPVISRLAALVEPEHQQLHGPNLWFACSRDRFRPARSSPDVDISVCERGTIHELYAQPGFTNALSYRADHPRPDMIATVARRDGRIVGIAAASADCDRLWQIGVDVIPEERRHGIGRALVSRLTEAVLNTGRIPCYSTAVSNIASRTLALRLGYWPAWTELYALEGE